MLDLFSFKEMEGKEEPVNVQFMGISAEDLLFWFEAGEGEGKVRVELPFSDFFGNYTKERMADYHLENYLLKDVPVIVQSVDLDKKTATVSFSKAKAILRDREKKEIDKRLEKGEEVKLICRVRRLNGEGWSSYAVLSPLNSYLKLFLPVAYYSNEFVNDIREVCMPNAVIEVKLLKKKQTPYKASAYDYIVSRAALLGSPWDNIENRLRRDDIVKVIVTGASRKKKDAIVPDRSEMTCAIEGFNINAHVRTRSALRLLRHHKYLAVVDSVDAKKRSVKLTAFRFCPDSEKNKTNIG